MKLTPEGRRTLYALQNQEWLDMPLSAAVLKIALELAVQSSYPATPEAIEKALHRRGVQVDIGAVPVQWLEAVEGLVFMKKVSA